MPASSLIFVLLLLTSSFSHASATADTPATATPAPGIAALLAAPPEGQLLHRRF